MDLAGTVTRVTGKNADRSNFVSERSSAVALGSRAAADTLQYASLWRGFARPHKLPSVVAQGLRLGLTLLSFEGNEPGQRSARQVAPARTDRGEYRQAAGSYCGSRKLVLADAGRNLKTGIGDDATNLVGGVRP